MLKNKTLVLPGVFNGASALLAEAAGFHAVYISGAGVSNGLAGLPDKGLLPLETVALQAKLITGIISIPAVVDADTGFKNIGKTVSIFEKSGVSGIQIEDQQFPKRCGHLPGKELVTVKAMGKKIRDAVRARKSSGFVIIARTDAKGVTGLNDAVERAKRYADCGADIIFPEALETVKEFEAFARKVNAPLMANMTEFGKTPYLTVKQFESMGYAIVLFPMTAFRVMMKSMGEAYQTLKKAGTQKPLLKKMQTRKELYELLKYNGF
ncbi:MAG: isocitrate lyase/phosphoenolpyruvate mutase family protein [Nitrospirae bacterium]|nr:isocitrate lyase/phosphoenolpyruvate mutase family protein [Nitrospirota bacterium]